MRFPAVIDRTFPAIAFARHVPPQQVAIRIGRRVAALAGMTAPPHGTAGLRSPEVLPKPVFEPRAISVTREAQGWRFTFLGRSIDMAKTITWTAPSASPGDQLWRMNLHYMEYLEVVPPAAGAEAITQWIAANPLDRSGARSDAWNAYALSIRTVCWLQWLARHPESATASLRAAMEDSLAHQFAFLARWPETDIGGNHLVKNAKALLWAAASMEGPDAAHWGSLGQRLLRRILADQILADGMHFELSPAYHCQVLADLVECSRVVPAGTLHDEVMAKIGQMFEACRVVTHPDGAVAQFGDAGLGMAYRIAEIAAAIPETESAPRSGVLASSGFGALHDSGFALVAKIGAIAADRLPAHGHGDIGAFELSVAGLRMIVDQGVYEYVAGPRREAARAAASHNLTIAGDGRIADFFGAFRLGRRPRSEAAEAQLSDNLLVMQVSHRGFRENGRQLRVTRELRASAPVVEIVDRIVPPPQGPVRTGFLLHPECAVQMVPEGLEILRGQGRILLSTEAEIMVEPAEWWPDMGFSRETRRILCKWGPTHAQQRFTLSCGANNRYQD